MNFNTDLKRWITEMSKCSQTDEWINLSDNLIKVFGTMLVIVQQKGLSDFAGININTSTKIPELWIKVNEIFLHDSEDDSYFKLINWVECMAKLVGSLRGSHAKLFFCIDATGNKINLLMSADENIGGLLKNIEAFFPGIILTSGKRKIVLPENVIYGGGVPSVIDEKTSVLPMDRMLSSMFGDTFTLIFELSPFSNDNINELISYLESIIDQLRVLNELNIQTGTAQGFKGVLNMNLGKESGNHLIELLSKDVERCKEGLTQGFWNTKIYLTAQNDIVRTKLNSVFCSIYGGPESKPMRIKTDNKPFQSILTSNEIATYFCMPVKEIPGVVTKPYFSFGDNITSHNDGIAIGKILYDMKETQNDFSINLESFTKHIFICGATGSGKTTTIKRILHELNERKIPFLVIEPVKSEYRIEGVNYIDVGQDKFSINLFEPAVRQTLIITHIDYLRSVFKASFVLYPPMPYVLESAIYKAYENKKFTFTDADKYVQFYPRIEDLIYAIEDVVNNSGYSSRLKDDILASLKIRMQNLLMGYKGMIFNSDVTFPSFKELMTKPTIINLNRVVDDEQKALLISILLANLYEYRGHEGEALGKLKHVTIIEEAHRLLAKTISLDGNPEAANPKSKAVEFFANILSEIRAYGEGLIIAEQIPTKLINDVIKNTGTKITHKLVSLDDKVEIGNAMNLEEKQKVFLTLLKPGQAVVFSENTVKPIVVSIRSVK